MSRKHVSGKNGFFKVQLCGLFSRFYISTIQVKLYSKRTWGFVALHTFFRKNKFKKFNQIHFSLYFYSNIPTIIVIKMWLKHSHNTQCQFLSDWGKQIGEFNSKLLLAFNVFYLLNIENGFFSRLLKKLQTVCRWMKYLLVAYQRCSTNYIV